MMILTPVSSLAEENTAGRSASELPDSLVPTDGPGIQYIMADRQGIVFEKNVGLTDIAGRVPLTSYHTFAAFSMTKTLTAIAFLQLHEAGKTGLDDKLSRHVAHPYGPDITIRQVLAHTAGIPNPMPLEWVHLVEKHDDSDEAAALARVLGQDPKQTSATGRKYSYSNIGYWLLGKVVESASGQSYTEYVTQHIFRPLGLESKEIAFTISDPGMHAKGYLAKYSFMNLVKGFVTRREVWGDYEGRWLHIRNVYVDGPSFGGAIGTARGFSRILQDLLADSSRLLGKNAKELLFTQQKNSRGEPVPMTLGWHIGDLDGMRYYYKEGGGAGFHGEMRIYPSSGKASVILTNNTSFNSRKELSRIDRNFIER
jgi:CubicO group peptidase (beta-lactamase class C family)